MNIKKRINIFRSFLMQSLTKNIGKSHFNENVDLSVKTEIKKVLICRPNGRLGNLLLITPLLQEITTTFPECKIDIFVKGNLAPVLFQNYKNIGQIIQLPKKPFKNLIKYLQAWISLRKQHYDITINVEQNSSSGRLSTQFAKSKYKFFGNINDAIQLKHKDHEHIAKYPVYSFRYYINLLGLEENDKKIAPLDMKLSTFEKIEGQKLLKKLVKNEKKTICLFTYATGAKCYSESWWAELYEKLKTEYDKDYNIIEVLPVENISRIAFKAPTFYSKDIREIGALIANSAIFIGADSGIMHLASAVKTPTIGLFSITNKNKYQPYDNNSTGIDTNNTNTYQYIQIINKILMSDQLKD